MKDGIKIVTIGGGSSYTPELMDGFIKRYHELPVREIWLVDVENGKDKLYKQIDIELFRYTAKTDKCVEFKISTVRKGKESKRIAVSACK